MERSGRRRASPSIRRRRSAGNPRRFPRSLRPFLMRPTSPSRRYRWIHCRSVRKGSWCIAATRVSGMPPSRNGWIKEKRSNACSLCASVALASWERCSVTALFSFVNWQGKDAPGQRACLPPGMAAGTTGLLSCWAACCASSPTQAGEGVRLPRPLPPQLAMPRLREKTPNPMAASALRLSTSTSRPSRLEEL